MVIDKYPIGISKLLQQLLDRGVCNSCTWDYGRLLPPPGLYYYIVFVITYYFATLDSTTTRRHPLKAGRSAAHAVNSIMFTFLYMVQCTQSGNCSRLPISRSAPLPFSDAQDLRFSNRSTSEKRVRSQPTVQIFCFR